jgi:hypothetical protein
MSEKYTHGMGTSDFISIDDSHWPLLVARFVGQPSLQQQEEYFAQFLGYLAREEKCVLILDSRQVRMMTAEHRQKLAVFARQYDALFRTRLLGCAAVITSPLMQLAASIVLHFIPRPCPFFTTTSLPEAVKWAAKRLEDAGRHPDAYRVQQHYGLVHTEQHVS